MITEEEYIRYQATFQLRTAEGFLRKAVTNLLCLDEPTDNLTDALELVQRQLDAVNPEALGEEDGEDEVPYDYSDGDPNLVP